MALRVHIVAGGPSENLPDLSIYCGEKNVWIGVDRGVIHLINSGIIPTYAFGDFDSITETERLQLQTKINHIDFFPAEKDQTDSEIGLEFALQMNEVEEIVLFGGTGGRLDHLFGNIQLLFKALEKGVFAKLIDKQNEVTLYSPGEYKIENSLSYKYISFLPFTEEIQNLTLKGFKYPLMNRHIERGSTLCISNELIHSVGTFSFDAGILMMVRSSDV
ncbi:thiamine diphosphokinase [Aeribacillus kexueae]|uniref:thiamine diphosphokinase n=1 Tax=Aeribacillus kexueae TaxID=2078952 RepID=UPI003AEF235E